MNIINTHDKRERERETWEARGRNYVPLQDADDGSDFALI